MSVQVRYFASLAERTGCATESYEVEQGADIQALWNLVVRRHAGLADLPFRPLVACDLTYASWDQALDGVAEVAFLPPVSGG